MRNWFVENLSNLRCVLGKIESLSPLKLVPKMVVKCTFCKVNYANYKMKGRGQPLLACVGCKKPNMVRVTNTCETEGCSTRATFGCDGDTKGRFCKKCSPIEARDVQNKKCMFKGCPHQPSYNYEGIKPPLYCSDHKKKNMVDIKSKRCKTEGCRKSPTYNIPGAKSALFCAKDALEGMVDVKNKKCTKRGCKNQPSFNFFGESKSLYCGEHLLDGMVDVRHPKCEQLGCKTRPVFNFEGEKRGIYCSDHALDGMTDIESARCQFEGVCNTRPSFNFPEESHGIFCETHMLKGMINVNQTVCEAGCGVHPMYNFPGEKNGRFCVGCKLDGMEDVVNKKCTKESCKKLATFALLFSEKSRCSKHKTLNMVPVNQRFPKCYECHVKDAYYAPPESTYPTHCEDHYPRTYINVVEKDCKSCTLPFFIPEDQEMCQDCRDFANPVVRHSKELRIKAVLEANKIPITTHDEVPMYACSKKRPDFVIDCGFFFLIIEVDENQHQSYDCSCELSRMIQLHQDFGGTPVVFIRYNPDNYTDSWGRKHKGYKQNLDREKRLINLIQKIRKKEEVFGALSAYFLYYDGDDGINRESMIDYYGFSIKDLVEDVEKQRKNPDDDSETEEE